MKFTIPPLQLRVASLPGVKGWRAAHPSGVLLAQDVRRDALYQSMARRNRRLSACLVVLLVLMLALARATVWRSPQAPATTGRVHVVAAAASTVSPEPAQAPGAIAEKPMTTMSSGSTDAIGVAAVAVERVPAIQQPTPPVAGVSVARPAPQVDRPIPAVGPKRAEALRAGGSGARDGAADSERAAAPPSARPQADVAINDFFGVNTAVMLSLHGGQTVRTYRVGDALPDGEVITSIDTNRGSVTTNRRTISNKEH